MAKSNGKSEVKTGDLDVEHELASGDSGEDEPRDAALLKLKAERDTLVDRLARLQAEFENARKRAAREQQENSKAQGEIVSPRMLDQRFQRAGFVFHNQ